MSDNIIDKAKEKLERVRVRERATGADAPARDDAATDPGHEARLNAAAATGGTPDIPAGAEEDQRRDPARPGP
jgi:hypothetical protein